MHAQISDQRHGRRFPEPSGTLPSKCAFPSRWFLHAWRNSGEPPARTSRSSDAVAPARVHLPWHVGNQRSGSEPRHQLMRLRFSVRSMRICWKRNASTTTRSPRPCSSSHSTDRSVRGACGQLLAKRRGGARSPFRSTPLRTNQESRAGVV